MTRCKNAQSSKLSPKLFNLILLFSLISFWIFLEIAPVDHQDWVKNILFFAALLLAVFTYRIFTFPSLSYFLLFEFLILHQIGAHHAVTSWALIIVMFMLAFAGWKQDEIKEFSGRFSQNLLHHS